MFFTRLLADIMPDPVTPGRRDHGGGRGGFGDRRGCGRGGITMARARRGVAVGGRVGRYRPRTAVACLAMIACQHQLTLPAARRGWQIRRVTSPSADTWKALLPRACRKARLASRHAPLSGYL